MKHKKFLPALVIGCSLAVSSMAQADIIGSGGSNNQNSAAPSALDLVIGVLDIIGSGGQVSAQDIIGSGEQATTQDIIGSGGQVQSQTTTGG
ncbi:MAG: hypothetical protein PVJ40_00915 [Gammaproteobacteria bacterium]|jgi:hypothetical protein